jgi:hypothetical protein
VPETYLDLLERIHAYVRPATYVEVGVHEGDSLSLAREGTRAIGIDPNPTVRRRLSAMTTVVRRTSDEVLPSDELSRLLGHRPIELAFIDGMHLFENALRDFIQLERRCTPRSIVLVHDCYPRDEITASRDRTTVFWSGDVWKLVLCLREHRHDLRIAVADVEPTGLAIVRGLDPSSRVLSDRYDELCARYVDMGYDAIADDKERRLGLVVGGWHALRKVLTERDAGDLR